MGALLLLAALTTAAPYTDRTISIGIAVRARELTLKPEAEFILRHGGAVRQLLKGRKYSLEAGPRGLTLDGKPLAASVRAPSAPPASEGQEALLEPAEPGNTIQVGSKLYRARLRVRADEDSTVTAVAETAMEDYLLGVVPYEMEPDWPLEALKAQAVVARTYAYYNLGKHRRAGFDLTSDTRSQMYGGLGKESELVRQAVRQTRGEVLGYKGELLQVYYHACCGGRTADAATVWGGYAPPPLKGVKDPWCARSPYYQWTAYFPFPAFLAAVSTEKMLGTRVKAIKIAARDKSGQVKAFSVRAGAETLTVKAVDLRRRLGSTELRSTRVEKVRALKKGVEFTGRGSGHGVGLCQWGARLQADDGRSYEKILAFYFPGSALSVVDE